MSSETATSGPTPLSPEAFALYLALADVCRAIRAEPGVSMRTCSDRLHSAVGSAEHLIEKYRPGNGSSREDD